MSWLRAALFWEESSFASTGADDSRAEEGAPENTAEDSLCRCWLSISRAFLLKIGSAIQYK
jgi:hypothetical protein